MYPNVNFMLRSVFSIAKLVVLSCFVESHPVIPVAAAPQFSARCLLSLLEEEDLGSPEPAAGGWPHSAAHPVSGGTGVPWQHR